MAATSALVRVEPLMLDEFERYAWFLFLHQPTSHPARQPTYPRNICDAILVVTVEQIRASNNATCTEKSNINNKKILDAKKLYDLCLHHNFIERTWQQYWDCEKSTNSTTIPEPGDWFFFHRSWSVQTLLVWFCELRWLRLKMLFASHTVTQLNTHKSQRKIIKKKQKM